MGVKVATFYLLSIASSLLAANQVAPSMNVVLSNESARGAITSYQVVNRSLKRDRLPIGQVGPETNLRILQSARSARAQPKKRYRLQASN